MLTSKKYQDLKRAAEQRKKSALKAEERNAKKDTSTDAKTGDKPDPMATSSAKRQQVQRDKRALQLRKIRPFLNKIFQQAVSNMTATNTLLDEKLADIKEYIAPLMGNDSQFNVEIIDNDNASKTWEFYWARRRLILSGIGKLDKQGFQKYLEDGKAQTKMEPYFLGKCFDEDDVAKQLEQILPPHEIVIKITSKSPPSQNARGRAFIVRLKGTSPKAPYSTIASSTRINKLENGPKALTDQSLTTTLKTLTEWVISKSPEMRDDFISHINNLAEKSAERERHISVYGHTKFVVEDKDNLDAVNASLNARLSAMKEKFPKPKTGA